MTDTPQRDEFQQSIDDILVIKVCFILAFMIGPAVLLSLSTNAARWCVDHGVVVAADHAVVSFPLGHQHVGFDLPRLVIIALGVMALLLVTIQVSIARRRARIRRALRAVSRG